MELTEKVREELKMHRSFRTYFDSGSHEYNQTELKEKTETVARIIQHGFDFHKLIKDYKSNYNSDGYFHIYKNVSRTLIELISYIRTGNIFDPTTRKKLENAKENEVIANLIEIVKTNLLNQLSLDSLITSYLDFKFEGKLEEYQKQSAFFKIDFEKDNDSDLAERFEKENINDFQWNYVALNHFLKLSLFRDLYQNKITYLDPEFQMPITKGILFFIHKHFPKTTHQKLETDNEYRRAKIHAFTKDIVEILYLNRPLFNFNIFYIRNNFSSQEMRNDFFANNQVAIHIDQPTEIEDFNFLLLGQKRKNAKTEFVGRWLNIDKSLKEKDALIVSSYLGNDTIKIGFIPKGSTFFELEKNSEYKVFQLFNTVEISSRENQIFSALIPAQTTTSPIYKRTNYIIHKYTSYPLSIDISNLSEKSLELICLEWLRSDLCPKDFKLKFQLLLTGGNYGKVDVYGHTLNGISLSAQVTNSNSKETVKKKTEKLKTFNSEIKLMFCDLDSDNSNDIPVISIKKVWLDLYENGYKEMLEILIKE